MILFDRRVYPSSGWNSLAIIKRLLDQEGEKKGLCEVRLKGNQRRDYQVLPGKQAAFGDGPSLIAISLVLYSSSAS